MKHRVIVSAVIEDGNKLLFGRKRENVGPYPNTWHILGGGINFGEESLVDGIKREIKEEANINVDIIESLGFDEDYEKNKHGELVHYVFLVFKAKMISGELKADDDIKELKWISRDDLSNYTMNRPSIKLFKRIGYL
tara:strand:+ start:212 stop:622 length:411 start_codon:yes stop_codon:yes gene_type:complete